MGIWFCLILSLLGQLFWLFDLFSHFFVQYALATLAITVLLLVLRAWRYVVLSCITLSMIFMILVGSYIP